MEANPEVGSAGWILRWGSGLASLLFAAAAVAYVIEGASIGAVLFAAASAVLFGVMAWRAWPRASRADS